MGNRYLEPESRSAELYARANKVMPGGNTRTTVFSAPYPAYVASAQGPTVIARVQAAQALLDASRTVGLAVSVEPPGGSPTGAPTGPVVFAGKLGT